MPKHSLSANQKQEGFYVQHGELLLSLDEDQQQFMGWSLGNGGSGGSQGSMAPLNGGQYFFHTQLE